MTLAELIIISTEIHTQLYDHWAIFISIHMALLGGLFAFDFDVKTSFKLSLLLFYIVFTGINLSISMNLLNQINAIVNDIQALGSQPAGHLETYLLYRPNYAKPGLITVHIITGLLVLVGIFIPSTNRHDVDTE